MTGSTKSFMFTLSARAIFLLNAKELNVIVVLALSNKK
ncbi:hypothetical protein P7266_1678 [Lactococcus cremoris]|nr:hypothetical protein P7266_1678 [Lactococcus cremoris]